jgi:hypothetical protein
MPRIENPLTVVISAPLMFILNENYGLRWVPCEEMPNCGCGQLHLVVPLEMLLESEFLEEEEAEELERRIEELEELEDGSEKENKLHALAVETHELLEERALYEAAALRAYTGFRLEGDPSPELFAEANL